MCASFNTELLKIKFPKHMFVVDCSRQRAVVLFMHFKSYSHWGTREMRN